MNPGEPARVGDVVIGTVKHVNPDGSADVELNEHGRRLYGPFVTMRVVPVPMILRALPPETTRAADVELKSEEAPPDA